MGDILDSVLERSREMGFLGPGPALDQRRHAEAFLTAIDHRSIRHAVDLGSGGGVPGLVLATLLPGTEWVLLDSMRRRTAFLLEAVKELGFGSRVSVETARAEDVGRGPLRGTNDLVVSRGFGSPAVTAECACPLLQVGGQLVVSEPPGSSGARWPEPQLNELGLEFDLVVSGPPGFVRLRQARRPPDDVPRRSGIPAKRPRW